VHEGHRRRFEGEQGGAEYLDAAYAEQQTIEFLLILTGRAIDLRAHQQNRAKTDHCLSEREDRMRQADDFHIETVGVVPPVIERR
jgi:hypothetical protein